MLKIAHISDIHFINITLNPKQFFSKRWVGNANALLSRRKHFEPTLLLEFEETIKNLDIDYLIITGDFSSTSQYSEFEKCLAFFQKIKQSNIKLLSIPGNHDQYTKKAFLEKRFYKFFENENSQEFDFELKKHGIEAKKIDEKWWYIGLDTAVATTLLSSRGLFSLELENNLKKLLTLIPKDESIILVNHYPFFDSLNIRRTLKRKDALVNVLKENKNIKLYLHGHTHKNKITDLRKENLPIIMDAGSITYKKSGSWNYLTIDNNQITVNKYSWIKNKWIAEKDYLFKL